MKGFSWIQARHLTKSYYASVIEERSEGQLICGYPLCANKIAPPPTTSVLQIRNGKIYDAKPIKVRPLCMLKLAQCAWQAFCSNFCYAASRHYEAQLSELPVGFVSDRAGAVTLLGPGYGWLSLLFLCLSVSFRLLFPLCSSFSGSVCLPPEPSVDPRPPRPRR